MMMRVNKNCISGAAADESAKLGEEIFDNRNRATIANRFESILLFFLVCFVFTLKNHKDRNRFLARSFPHNSFVSSQ